MFSDGLFQACWTTSADRSLFGNGFLGNLFLWCYNLCLWCYNLCLSFEDDEKSLKHFHRPQCFSMLQMVAYNVQKCALMWPDILQTNVASFCTSPVNGQGTVLCRQGNHWSNLRHLHTTIRAKAARKLIHSWMLQVDLLDQQVMVPEICQLLFFFKFPNFHCTLRFQWAYLTRQSLNVLHERPVIQKHCSLHNSIIDMIWLWFLWWPANGHNIRNPSEGYIEEPSCR